MNMQRPSWAYHAYVRSFGLFFCIQPDDSSSFSDSSDKISSPLSPRPEGLITPHRGPRDSSCGSSLTTAMPSSVAARLHCSFVPQEIGQYAA